MANEDSFHITVAGSPLYQARLDACVAHVMALGRASGADITRTEAMQLPAVRLAVLTDQPLSGEHFENEIASLGSVVEARERKAIKQRLEAGDEAETQRLARLRPSERMSEARRLDLAATPDDTPHDPDAETKTRILLELPPQARISKAREWGLTGQ